MAVELLTSRSDAATRSEQIAWAAGLFEGEGCISVSGSGRRKHRRLFVVSTDRDVLEKFMEIVGVGRIESKGAPGNRKPAWRWVVSNWVAIEEVGLMLLPHLCSRRREKMLSLLDDPPSRCVGRCKCGRSLTRPGADVTRHGKYVECGPCARRELRDYRARKKAA